MSSKDSILASIRRHTGARHEMPELTLEAITYADKLATFSEVLAGAGGKAIELKPGEDVNEVIRREFPEAKRIASNLKEITCATFNPDELTDPRALYFCGCRSSGTGNPRYQPVYRQGSVCF